MASKFFEGLRLSLRTKFRSGKRDFRRIRRDEIEQKWIHYNILKTEKDFSKEIELFDADKVKKDLLEEVELFFEDHDLIHDMEFIVNAEELRIINSIRELKNKLSNLKLSNSSDDSDFSNTVAKEIKDLENLLYELRKVIVLEKKRARDLVRDRDKFRDKSFLPYVFIYSKIKHLAKKGKRDARLVKKYSKKINDLIKHLDEKNVDTFKKTLKDFQTSIDKDEDELKDELKILSRIDYYLTVVEFKENDVHIIESLKLLREKDFPEETLTLIENKFREMLEKIEELHKETRSESKVLKREV